MSLLEGQGERWQIIKCALRSGFKCVGILPFCTDGYDVKRTRNGKSFKSSNTRKNHKSTLKSLMYCFSLHGDQYAGPSFHDLTAVLQVGKKRKFRTSNGGSGGNLDATKQSTKLVQEGKKFLCQECGKAFSSAQGKRTHMHMVHTLKLYDHSKLWKCSKCDGKVFSTADGLYQHNVAKHSFSTDACEKPTTEIALKGNSDPTPMKTCKVCGTGYKGSYREHITMLIPRAEPSRLQFQCPFCNKYFVNERARQQHARFCSMSAANSL